MRLRHGTTLACLLLVLVAGCGDEGGRASDPAGSPSPTRTTPTAPATDVPVTPPSDGLTKIRVVGQVVGVGGCVVVRDDNDTTWTITGDRAGELVLHDRVQVTGTPNIASTGCGGPVVEARTVTVVPPIE